MLSQLHCSYTEDSVRYKRLLHTSGLMRSKLTSDCSKLVIATTGGYLMVIHDLDLATLPQDLEGFRSAGWPEINAPGHPLCPPNTLSCLLVLFQTDAAWTQVCSVCCPIQPSFHFQKEQGGVDKWLPASGWCWDDCFPRGLRFGYSCNLRCSYVVLLLAMHSVQYFDSSGKFACVLCFAVASARLVCPLEEYKFRWKIWGNKLKYNTSFMQETDKSEPFEYLGRLWLSGWVYHFDIIY